MRISHEPPPVVPTDMVQEPDAKNILSNIFGPLDAEQIYFPDSDDLNTQAILKNIQRGVVIIVKPNGDICATRLCQARVYVADNALSAPRLLNRSEETLIYSFQNDFVPKLIEYQNGASCAAPSCERYFSLGQQWRPGLEPLNEMLTHFSVTHFLAKKIFKEIKAQKPLFVEMSNTTSLDMIQKQLQQMALANKNNEQKWKVDHENLLRKPGYLRVSTVPEALQINFRWLEISSLQSRIMLTFGDDYNMI